MMNYDIDKLNFLHNAKLVYLKNQTKKRINDNNFTKEKLIELTNKIEKQIFKQKDSKSLNILLLDTVKLNVSDSDIFQYVKFGIKNFKQLDLIDKLVFSFVISEILKENYELKSSI